MKVTDENMNILAEMLTLNTDINRGPFCSQKHDSFHINTHA